MALRSVGAGWAGLVDHLFELKPADTLVVQVKEKFGGLRFYVDHSTDMYNLLVSRAEADSLTICERCGAREGVTCEGGWLKTLCASCRHDFDRKKIGDLECGDDTFASDPRGDWIEPL